MIGNTAPFLGFWKIWQPRGPATIFPNGTLAVLERSIGPNLKKNFLLSIPSFLLLKHPTLLLHPDQDYISFQFTLFHTFLQIFTLSFIYNGSNPTTHAILRSFFVFIYWSWSSAKHVPNATMATYTMANIHATTRNASDAAATTASQCCG